VDAFLLGSSPLGITRSSYVDDGDMRANVTPVSKIAAGVFNTNSILQVRPWLFASLDVCLGLIAVLLITSPKFS